MKCIYKYAEWIFLCSIFILEVNSTFNHFDDTILYSIKWPGKTDENLLDNENIVNAVTDKQEHYVCILPDLTEKEENSEASYAGPNPLDLLKPLFAQATCSYRLETYWTYEVCHGKFVKQYHEERDGKKIKRQEYYLGRWDLIMQNELSRQLENVEYAKHTIKTKKIEGMDVPYLQLNYTDGTLCDLNEEPRQTNVLYMCFDHARHDIYSIKEISTCLYEAIIFTPLLCVHPLYRPMNSAEKSISCIPSEGTNKKPKNLVALENESLKLKHDQLIDDDQVLKKVFAVFSVDKNDGQEIETRLHVQIHPVDTLPELNVPSVGLVKSRVTDVSDEIADFLSGVNCLEGGKGWWKFEFCYGKHVTQFHEEANGSRTIKKLGKFIFEDHKTWLENNPVKKPRKTAGIISHFYSKGDFCKEANTLRETEVKFKCSAGSNVSPSSIMLLLVEPQTCKYVLYVESPLICKLTPHVDEYGMFDTSIKINENDEL